MYPVGLAGTGGKEAKICSGHHLLDLETRPSTVEDQQMLVSEIRGTRQRFQGCRETSQEGQGRFWTMAEIKKVH